MTPRRAILAVLATAAMMLAVPLTAGAQQGKPSLTPQDDIDIQQLVGTST
jgi:hypothetical protein